LRFWAAKKQTQFKANQSQYYLAPRFIWGLKKQSQFAGGQIGVKSYLKGNYGNKPVLRRQKTKPIQSQTKRN